MESKYLEFEFHIGTGKTSIFFVKSKSSGAILGEIKWYGPWRQYCFFPFNNCVFNDGCLKDICQFINLEMQKRRMKGGNDDG